MMISEQALAALSYPEMPKRVTNSLPGPKTRQFVEDALKYQSPTRPSVRSTLAWVEGRGAGLKDPDGNVFLDLSSGVAVSAVGRSHPKVVEAIRRQADLIMHTAGQASPTTVQLARRLSELMPVGLRDDCFTWFGMSGSGAVETAIKFARAITGRTQIVAFEGAYHGVFHGSLALTCREDFRRGFRPFMPEAMHVPYAYCYRCFADLKPAECKSACAKYVEYKLATPYTGADNVAAVIVEPMQGEGGYVVPPPEFIRTIAQVCEERGILLIADEIQVGGGRTGKMWGIEHYGVAPDMLVWGKAIGGDLPLSGVTIASKYQDKLPRASQVITSAEDALANAVALVNLELLGDPEMDLLGRATALGEEVMTRFQAAARELKTIGEVRGLGLFIGIELVRDRESRKPIEPAHMHALMAACEQRGVRILPCGRYGSVLRLMPPLIITREHLNHGVDVIIEAIREQERQ
jgi:4-aminobutyrate aminotransferase